MTEKSSRWMWVVLSRVASYAIAGGLTTALAGALLIAASGAVVGAITDAGTARPTSVLTKEIMALWGALFGAVFGATGGGFAGLILFGMIGFGSAARRSSLPPKSALRPILAGMAAATFGIMTSYFVGCALFAWVRGSTFTAYVEEGVMFILFAAPAVMVCGQIAGAIWAYRREKEARRAASALPIEPA